MTKIIISILSFLLIFFPFSGTLQSAYQNLTFPGQDVIISNIIDAVESNDTDALEEMFSENQKNSIPQLSNKLESLVEMIDGEIIDAKQIIGVGHESVESGMGYAKKHKNWWIEFKTTKDTYYLLVGWNCVDTLNPKNVGLHTLALMDSEGYNETFEHLIIIEQ